MSSEKIPTQPEPKKFELPGFIPERMKLIKDVDSLVEEWATRKDIQTRILIHEIPMAKLIINDCIIIDDVNEEFARREFPEDPKYGMQKRWFEKRMYDLMHISELANVPEYTTEPINDELFARELEVIQIATPETPEGDETIAAALYLRRLFVAREKMAALNGLPRFDTTYFHAVLNEL